MTIARAFLYLPIVDNQGNVIPNITVRFYQPDTTTQITDVIYAQDSGNSQLSPPVLFADGVVRAYLPLPKRVRIGIQPGGQSEFYLENVDFRAAGDNNVLADQVLVVKGTPAAGQILSALPDGTAAWVGASAIPVAGLVVHSPDGSAWTISVDNGGHITATK